MGYAVRADKMGFRAVSGPEELEPGETYSAAPPPRPVDLIALANAHQANLAAGGFAINFGSGDPIRFSTDALGLALLNGAVSRQSLPNPPATVQWQVAASSFVPLSGAQVVAAGILVADFVNATFETLQAVLAGVAGGTITTPADIAAYAWPVSYAAVP